MSKRRPPTPHLRITKEAVDKILSGLRAGLYFETAVALAGVKNDTARLWLRRANKPQGESPEIHAMCVTFLEGVVKANAESEARHVMAIAAASQAGTWTASAWHLERKHPERWGRERLTKEESQARAELMKLQVEKMRAEIALLEAKAAGDVSDTTIVVSPGDKAFDQLMIEKWGGPRQTTPRSPSEQVADGGRSQEGMDPKPVP